MSTPGSESLRRLSDPAPAWERSDAFDSWRQSGEQLPSTVFGDHDGPPWSEDEDLASPVVTSAKHRKNKSNMYAFDQTTRGRGRDESPRRFLRSNHDGSDTYFAGAPSGADQIPSRGLESNSPAGLQQPTLRIPTSANRRDSHFARPVASASRPLRDALSSSPDSPDADDDDDDDDDESLEDIDDNRYSRDYQFTIASPDEEMHGRAVALFDLRERTKMSFR